jgi:putative inorganic carbon (HCO3(-)) transporter
VEALGRVRERGQRMVRREPLSGAYFWLAAFFIVYCARPEDWIPGLHLIPIAKISGLLALLALLLSLGRAKRRLQDLPLEILYLFLLIGQLFASAMISPVWRGGAFFNTLDFAKAFVTVLVIVLAVTTLSRLRRLLFIQTASVVAVGVISVIKGHSRPRLTGVLHGIYENPNDLAFAIVLMLPFCFAFLLKTGSWIRKAGWAAAMLVLVTALFLTASRAGLIALIVTGMICLWHFAIKGRRPHLLIVVTVIVAALALFQGNKVKSRFLAMSGQEEASRVDNTSAYGSYLQRRELMVRSWSGILKHPLFGIGTKNFVSYSGMWREVHNSFLQICVEGGLPALALYLLIFWQAFANLRRLKRIPDLDDETKLYYAAFQSTLVGFLVGASFAPEAYQYFPYFTVSYTWVLLAIAEDRRRAETKAGLTPAPAPKRAAAARQRRSAAVWSA